LDNAREREFRIALDHPSFTLGVKKVLQTEAAAPSSKLNQQFLDDISYKATRFLKRWAPNYGFEEEAEVWKMEAHCKLKSATDAFPDFLIEATKGAQDFGWVRGSNKFIVVGSIFVLASTMYSYGVKGSIILPRKIHCEFTGLISFWKWLRTNILPEEGLTVFSEDDMMRIMHVP